MYTIYGIPNCGSVKKTIDFFKDNSIPYNFLDFKKNLIEPALISTWIDQVGLGTIVNKQGITYRKMDESTKHLLAMDDTACQVILSNLSVIKRPVIMLEDQIIAVGYQESLLRQLL